MTKAHLTCPKCHAVQDVDMPTDACRIFIHVKAVVKY